MATVKVDYLAFSYYASRTLNSDRSRRGTAVNNYMLFGNQDNPFLKATEWNWQIDPLGFGDRSSLVTITIGACRCSRLKTASGVVSPGTANIPLPMITASLTIATISTP